MWGDFLANMGVDGDAAGLGGRLFHIRVRSFSYTLSALDGHCWLVLYFRKLSCNVRPYQTERSRTGVTLDIRKVCRLSLLHPLVVGCEGFL